MTNGNVVNFLGTTTLDLPPDRVLQAAVGRLDNVLVLGWDTDGKEYFASSMGDRTENLWLVEKFKMMLLNLQDEK